MTSLNKVQPSFLNIVFNDVKKTCNWLLSEHVDLANTGKKIAVLATFIIGSAAIFTGLVFSGGLPLVAIPIIAVGSSLITSLVLGSYLRTSYCVNKQELESGAHQAEQSKTIREQQPETIREQLNRLICQDMSQEQQGNIEEQLNKIPENEREEFVKHAEKVIVQIKQADFSPNKEELDNNQNIVRFVEELGKIPNDERDRFATQVYIMIVYRDKKNNESKSKIISQIAEFNNKKDRYEYFWNKLICIQNIFYINQMEIFLSNLDQSHPSTDLKNEFKQDLLNLIRGDQPILEHIMYLMGVLVKIPEGERNNFISQINKLIKDGNSMLHIYFIMNKLKQISSDKRDDFVNQALRIINCIEGNNLEQTLIIMGLLVEIPEEKREELVDSTIQAVCNEKGNPLNIVEIMNRLKETDLSE
jgi:predicted Holliday junction resolvase-like endonuclease